MLTDIVSKNLGTLLELRAEDTVSAARKARMDQKTVWNCINPETCNPTLKKIDALSLALRVDPPLLMIDSAFENGEPVCEVMGLMGRILKLPPIAQRQVSEFIEAWERVSDV